MGPRAGRAQRTGLPEIPSRRKDCPIMNPNHLQDAVDAALGNMAQVLVPLANLMVLLLVLKAMLRSGRRGGRGRDRRTVAAAAQVEV